jgi:hypothetical protein
LCGGVGETLLLVEEVALDLDRVVLLVIIFEPCVALSPMPSGVCLRKPTIPHCVWSRLAQVVGKLRSAVAESLVPSSTLFQ